MSEQFFKTADQFVFAGSGFFGQFGGAVIVVVESY